MLEFKTVSLVYFTGTGGTTRIANCFEEAFKKQDIVPYKTELCAKTMNTTYDTDLLVILFSVYAMNAPLPIAEWLENVRNVNGKPAVVISVSGGGEVTPNTACRRATIKKLESKGYNVIYEKMLVMPSNWIVGIKDDLAIRLLKAAPVRVEQIVSDIIAGKRKQTKPNFINKFFSIIGRLEKKVGKNFSKKIKVCDTCISCGWCANNCPRENITMTEGKPVFGEKCVICLRCIYGCPQKALELGGFKFILVKEGYDLKAVEKRMENVTELESIDVLAKGWALSGIKKYLEEE